MSEEHQCGSSCSGSCGSCSSREGCGSCADRKLSEKLDQIKRKIFVLSGKGRVGKSSVAASMALALAKKGLRVGLLDADFHGPSLPTVLGVTASRLGYSEEQGIEPLQMGNLKLVSIGLLLDEPDQAVVWRGPVKMGVIKQLLSDTDWGVLDVLILDFPPGTGDEILSACQLITGDKTGVVVTTPQEVSLADCRKCLDFCRQAGLPVRGIVENLSYFRCPQCQTRHHLFSSGGGQKLAEKYQVPLLAQLPLDPEFMLACDQGTLPVRWEDFPALRVFENL